MYKIIVFTDKEAEDLCYDRKVEYVDRNGIKTIFMNETCYRKHCRDEYFKDDEEEF